MTLIARAMAFSANAHAEQTDKNNQPYIWHPVRVAQGLRSAGYSETHQAVGLLHDTVEDQPITLADIEHAFGRPVCAGVDSMTRRRDLETGEWAESYDEYIVRCCEGLIGRAVKRFDVYDNADPKRYCPGVPTKRYIKTLDYLNEIDKDNVVQQWEGTHRSN